MLSLLDKLKKKPIPKVKKDFTVIVDKNKEVMGVLQPIHEKTSIQHQWSAVLDDDDDDVDDEGSASIHKKEKPQTLKNLKLYDLTKSQIFDKSKFFSDLKDNKEKHKPTVAKIETQKSQTIKPKDTKLKPVKKEKVKVKDLVSNKDLDKMSKIKTKKGTISQVNVMINKEDPENLSVEFKEELNFRLPDENQISIPTSGFYMNNREYFINFINNYFKHFKTEIMEESLKVSCTGAGEGRDLFIHQKIVKDYLTNYTPYRGLLMYHGLGAGKTCGSIAIAEGMKHSKRIMVLTPASLRRNYLNDLKKCGDKLYKINQYWSKIKYSDIKPDEMLKIIKIMNLNESFVKKQGGIWFVDVRRKPNYESLSTDDKNELNNQIDEMVYSKYTFINYNGLQKGHLETMTDGGKENPFDNKVVIIDEAHNFVSRIVNKLKKPKSLSMELYKYLMLANNVKIVFLTGTPVINYPNEIGILFNILRGFIKTWKIPLDVKSDKKIDQDFMENILGEISLCDYIEYKPSTRSLVVTRNPYGFINFFNRLKRYDGVKLSEQGDILDNDFINILEAKLLDHNIRILRKGINIELFKALPDTFDEFNARFIKDNGELDNINLFKRRILGLTSYFRSAQESLMPSYNELVDFHEELIDMSDYQFPIYEEARENERDQDKKNMKKKKSNMMNEIYTEAKSTYRIFSRAFCNFVFPEQIKRPFPGIKGEVSTNINEDMFEGQSLEERLNNPDGSNTTDDMDKLKEEIKQIVDYNKEITKAYESLEMNAHMFLNPLSLKVLSPKFLRILENIHNLGGSQLIYSQFRKLEGIGIFSLVLKTNGFTQFKIRKNVNGEWKLDINEEDRGKQTYAFYTGTETPEEKEIIRNIYNSDWNLVPESLVGEIRDIHMNNLEGEIIKVLMITSSGAEGINLKNTRYVHIMEPYWHPVRMEQVIGRARRICSHISLPKEKQKVEVFLYLMKFSEQQIKENLSVELKLKDKSKFSTTPFTTDQTLNEIAQIKRKINSQILTAIKETSIDCYLHNNKNEKLKCFSFGSKKTSDFSFIPSISGEESDEISNINKVVEKWIGIKLVINQKNYVVKKGTKEVYDYDSFMEFMKDQLIKPTYLGNLIEDDKGNIKGIQFND
jgi:hypothetical protein